MNEEKAPEYGGFSSEPATPLEVLERIIASLPPGNPARRELIDLRSSVAEQEEMISEARHTIEKLDEVEREVVELLFFLGSSQREAGEVLGIHEDTVKRRWAKAKRELTLLELFACDIADVGGHREVPSRSKWR